MPSLTEFSNDISAILEKATTPPAEPMTIMNDTEWGTFEASTDAKESFIVGEKSRATAKITKEVILLSRWQAASLYEKEFTRLIQNLSLHECSNKIKKNS